MQALGVNSAGALADALGMRGRHDHSKIAKWITGETAPNYSSTMELLRHAGWLLPEALETKPGTHKIGSAAASAGAAEPDRVDELRRKLDEALELLRRGRPEAAVERGEKNTELLEELTNLLGESLRSIDQRLEHLENGLLPGARQADG